MPTTGNKNLIPAIALLLFVLVSESCRAPSALSRSEERQLNHLLLQSEIFNSGFTGFVLTDSESGETIASLRGNQYFTPASNAKIFTLFAALEILRDSIPLFAYAEKNDSLYILPTGGPAFNSPFMETDKAAANFFERLPAHQPIVLCRPPLMDSRFGPGWAWDGYPYNYQTERSAFSLYGNRVKYTFVPGDTVPKIEPGYFEYKSVKRPNAEETEGLVMVSREERSNQFFYRTDGMHQDSVTRYIPFIPDDSTTQALFLEATGKNLLISEDCALEPEDLKYLIHSNPDSLYRRFMQSSDNYLAEQLLYSVSYQLFDTIHAYRAIQYVLDSMLGGLPQPINWWDGSGLSRYNLFTPESVIYVLKKLHQRPDFEEVLSYFPAGGKSGTIRNWYSGEEEPFVFAKTGTLRNHHCLSGYMQGDSGRWYLLSFMHNNFSGSSIPHRAEMERVLIYLRERL